MERDRVEVVVGEWGLRVLGVEVPVAGTMNETLIVATPGRRVVLRGHRRRDRGRIEFEHDVMRHAREQGLPVPAAILSPGGERIVEHDGRFYSLFEHARGRQVRRDDLDEAYAAAMGCALGRLHTALLGFGSDDAPRARHDRDVRAVLGRIEELLAHLDAIDDPQPQGSWARERLESRAAWLEEHVVLPAPAGDPVQLVHGDYQDSNLFFDEGEVSGIIDWDKAELRAPGEEVLRAMHLSLLPDVGKCRAFLIGYRSVTAMPSDQLHRAAVTYSHDRVCDLWLYETVYLHGDDRPRRFLSPGQFTAFLDQWGPVQAAIDA